MLSTKISSKGQVVVPKKVREKLNIQPGTYLHVRIDKESIVFTPVKKRPIDKLYGKFIGESILNDLEREHADEISRDHRS